MLPVEKSTRGLYLGVVAQEAAERGSATEILLDHDLTTAPDAGRRLTVTAFAEIVDDLAARLHAAGVRPGEFVVIYRAGGLDINLLSFAAARAGAIPVQLSPALGGHDVMALMARLGAPYLVTDAARLRGPLSGHDAVGRSARTVTVDGPHPGCTPLAELAGAPRIEPVLRGPDEPALLTHTSGTTGVPKLLVHSPRSLHGRYRPQARLFGAVPAAERVALHVSSVHSRMALALALLLRRGNPTLVVDDPAPDHIAEEFLAFRPGFVESAPNSFMEWEVLRDDPREPLASVKYFSTTFDAIHPGTMERLLTASRRDSPLFFQIYGQTETGPLVGRTFTAATVRDAGRCQGHAFPGDTKFRIVPRDGHEPSEQHPGYIEVQAAGRALTYRGEDERFARQVHGDWWRGLDIGYRTEEGCLHLLDREVDTIAGIHSTLEVEDAVLARMPEIGEFVLLPGPDGDAVPVVSTREGTPLDRDRWRAAVADFPPLAEPVEMALADLPRTATMKVQRVALRERLGEMARVS
jgi:acyl-coenzyme A synthetase/AMP-(fatty) acid ligase